MTTVTHCGVEFTLLRRPSVRTRIPMSDKGRVICPLCYAAGRDQVGAFEPPPFKRLAEHIEKQHYRCECGWVGLHPRGHLRRSKLHDGKPPNGAASAVASDYRVGDLR